MCLLKTGLTRFISGKDKPGGINGSTKFNGAPDTPKVSPAVAPPESKIPQPVKCLDDPSFSFDDPVKASGSVPQQDGDKAGKVEAVISEQADKEKTAKPTPSNIPQLKKPSYR